MSITRAAGRRPIPDVRTPAVAASRGGSSPVRSATRLSGSQASAAACARMPIMIGFARGGAP